MLHYDDEKIKRYLLGNLPADEAEAMEIAIATNISRTERLRDVECELVDDFLSNRLSAADAEAFETNFLVTAPRLARFRVAGEIKLLSKPEFAPPPPPPPARSLRYAAFAGAGLLAILAGGIFIAYNGLRSTGDVASVVVTETPSTVVLIPDPAVAVPETETRPALPVVTPSVLVKPSMTRSPIVAATLPTITIRLNPGSLRGEEEQSVTIPPSAKTVTILLRSVGSVNRFSHFHAILKTPENGLIMTSSDLSTPRFTIDAAKLEKRTYVISLEGENKQQEIESIADYTFRVR